MKTEVDCIILWHNFDANGKLTNASSTHLIGTMDNLNDRLKEAHEKCERNRQRGCGYTIAAQIVSNRL